MDNDQLDKETVTRLAAQAWEVRERARLWGHTKVGCAALDETGRVFSGCNIEHRFRSHDIHAEVNAISSLVAAGGQRVVALLIAATMDRFTPCGGCMDWIMEIGGPECHVIFQPNPDSEFQAYRASDLMPHYPRAKPPKP